MPFLPKIFPNSPDPYLERLGSNKSQASLARLAHINALVGQINLNTADIAILFGLIGAPAPINIGKSVFIDGTFGNNATALRQRFDKPFLTPAAAVAAALPGDTIIWRPGTYSVFSNLLKAGVNHYAQKGVFLNIFGDPFNLDTTLGGPVVVGNIDFRGHAVILSCTGNFCRVRANPSAILNLEFDQVNINNISNGVILFDGLTNLTIRGNYTCAGRAFSMRGSGGSVANLVAHIDGVVTTTFANGSNGVYWSSGSSFAGSVYIKAKSFVLPTTAVGGLFGHIYQDNSLGCEIDIELDYLYDTSLTAPSIATISSAFVNTGCLLNLRIKDVRLSARSFFNIGHSLARAVIQYDTAVGISTGASCGDGAIDLKNSHIVSNFNIAVGTPATAVLSLNNTYYQANSTEAIRQLTGGVVSLMGSTLVTDGIMPSIANPAGITLSEGSKANVAPAVAVTGNLYINPLYVN